MTTNPGASGCHRIAKTFGFSASHQLWQLPPEHKCSRDHGHNYTVTVVLTADSLDGNGFVTDFGELAPFGEFLANTFDHRVLNEVVSFHPTSELLAQHLGQWFIEHLEPNIHGRLVSMQVSETETSYAVWERN